MVAKLRLALFLVVIGLLVAAPPVSAGPKKHTSRLWTFADENGDRVDPKSIPHARSTLTRGEDTVCMTITTRQLPPGAYTNWWIIYNNPETCEFPEPVGRARCSEADLFNPDVNASALWATGGIVGPDGVSHFSGCLEAGAAPGFVIFGPGLVNVQGAEIQIVLKNHGPVSLDPTELGTQLTTLSGTEPPCDPSQDLPFQCPDPQFTIHPARK